MPDTKILQKENSISEQDFIVQQFMRYIGQNIVESANLLDKNITDSTYKIIHEFITDPISSSINSIRSAEENAKKIITKLLYIVIKNKKDLIKSVYRCNDTENMLQYFIILNEDNIKNRAKVNDIISFYEQLKISDKNQEKLCRKFPLIIEYLPAEFENELTNVEQVNLDDE